MDPRTRNLTLKLALVVPAMFAFAVVAMPPLYDLACEVLGLRGSEAARTAEEGVGVDTSRRVQIVFLTDRPQGSALEFHAPEPRVIDVHPGEWVQVRYRARNGGERPLTAQAVHTITPGEYARHVKLVKCFCYDEQTYRPGEERELPVAFTVSPDLPRRASHLTFSYAFYERADDHARTAGSAQSADGAEPS